MQVTVLTDDPLGAYAVLPALEAIDHDLATVPLTGPPTDVPPTNCILVDGRHDLPAMVAACRSDTLRALDVPVFLVAAAHSLAVLKVSWGFDDWVLPTCTAAELVTRLRLCLEVWRPTAAPPIAAVGLEINLDTYTVVANGRELNLTYTEFVLLQALVAAPDRVWTRAALLTDVWGYAHPGGTRTVDVHIRRLRAKLGPELAATIQTVRKVGYRFVTRPADRRSASDRSAGGEEQRRVAELVPVVAHPQRSVVRLPDGVVADDRAQ